MAGGKADIAVMGGLVLIAADDPEASAFLRRNVGALGFETITAVDGETALTLARDTRPALVLIDAELPVVDGLEVCRRLRAAAETEWLPLVVVTRALTVEARLACLEAGADEYVVQPFDTEELLARLQATVRHVAELRGLSPLTGLPGEAVSRRALDRLLAAGAPWAVLYMDIDGLHAFNERYGYDRGNGLIMHAGQTLREVAEGFRAGIHAIAHRAGDDFTVVADPDVAEEFALAAGAAFDTGVTRRYDPDDCAAGFITLPERRGDIRRYPIASLSIGIAWSRYRDVESRLEAERIARAMLDVAKHQPRTAYVADRRLSVG